MGLTDRLKLEHFLHELIYSFQSALYFVAFKYCFYYTTKCERELSGITDYSVYYYTCILIGIIS